MGEQELSTRIFSLFCGHEYRFRLANARIWLVVAVIWWMCLFHVRALVI